METDSEKNPKKSVPGVITVMLAMTMFLILSLILLSLESARLSCEKTALALNLQTAMASVSGEYDSALFENYGIYGICRSDIEELLKGYLKVSENPAANRIGNASGKNGFFMGDDITDVKVSNPVSLTDGGGILVKNQMIAEGALDGATVIMEKLLDAANLLDANGSAGRVLAAKMAAEQELAGMDFVLIRLMQTMDGAPVSEGGYTFLENGQLAGMKHFVKCIVMGEPTRKQVAIDNEPVYTTALPRMTDLKRFFNDMENLVQVESISDELIQKRLILLGMLDIVMKDVDESIRIVTTLEDYQRRIAPLVTTYEKLLMGGKSVLGEETFGQYCTELERMKRYVGTSSEGGYDFGEMRRVLLRNRECLGTIVEIWENMSRVDGMLPRAWEKAIIDSREAMAGYSLQKLRIEYGGIQGKVQEADESLWNTVKSFFADGFDGYLLGDVEELSERILLDENRPSLGVAGEEKELFSLATPTAEELTDTKYLNRYMETEQLSGFAERLRSGLESAGEKMLLLSYLNAHFENYTALTNPGVLAYEQEYLLFGAPKDRTNLRKTALSILGLRSLVNVVYAVSDPVLSKEALAVTGVLAEIVPFAAIVVQYAILTAVGLENALLETMELLEGKTVPLIENASEFQTGIKDLAGIGKATMHSKASSYIGCKGFGLNYSQYVLLFLLITDSDKLVPRAMDLIQGNLQRSDAEFCFSDCLYSFGVTVTIRGEHLFSNVINVDGLGFSEDVGVEVSGAFAY